MKGGDFIKKLRLPLQIIAILLQVYFIIETARLYTCGYVMFMGEPVGPGWFSMLFTLVIVVGCEVISFLDAFLFVISKRNKYSVIYLMLVILNALLFMTLAYYSMPGTVICLVYYAVLFILRIINLGLNVVDIVRKT